jgi:hypothetical protein
MPRRVLAFEVANAPTSLPRVSDRGDDFSNQFADRYNALLTR